MQQPEWINWQQIERDPVSSKVVIVDHQDELAAALSIFIKTIPISYQGEPSELPKTTLWKRSVLIWPTMQGDVPDGLVEVLESSQATIEIMDPTEEHAYLTIGSLVIDGTEQGLDAQDILRRVTDYAKAHKVGLRQYRTRREPKPEPRPEPEIPDAWVPSLGKYNKADIDLTDPASWPEPIDLFSRPPLPPLGRHMIPPELWPYIQDQSELLGQPPDMMALACLFSVGACVHDGIRIQPKRHDYGWTEPARLWAAVVGDPSVRKTPALLKAMKPLTQADMTMADSAKAEWARFDEEFEQWKEDAKRAKKAGHPIPSKPEPPPRKRLLVSDTTLEAMEEIVKDNPRGMVATFDELSGFFGQMDAYRANGASKDRSAWLEAYNGGARRVDRVGRGAIRIENWSVRVIGGIQPRSIQAIAHKLPEDGLLQRFMIVLAPASHEPEQDRRPDEQAKRTYFDTLAKIFAMEPSDEHVKFSDDAQDIRQSFEDERMLFMRMSSVPAPLQTTLGKWAGLFCRLCLAYHAVHCATLGKHPVNVLVSAETARSVSAYLMEYLLFHGLEFWNTVMGGDDRAAHAHWIAGHISAKKLPVIGSRDIHRAYKQWGRLADWQQRDVMRILEDAAWITPTTQMGKRTTTWAVNPKAHLAFSDHGAKIEADRVSVRAKLVEMQERRSGADRA